MAADFHAPECIEKGEGNTLYISDNGRIRRLDLSTRQVTTVAGSTLGFADGIGDAAKFNKPRGLAFHGTNLYVSDENGIRKIDLPTRTVTTILPGRMTGSVAVLHNILYYGKTIRQSFLYGDTMAEIWKYNLETGENERFVIRVPNIYGDDPRFGDWITLGEALPNGYGKYSGLENAASIRVHNGNLYVTDYVDIHESLGWWRNDLGFRCRIFQISPDGTGTLLYGSAGLIGRELKGFFRHILHGNLGSEQQVASLRTPTDLAFVGNDIYVTDMMNQRIAKLLPSTQGMRNGRQYTKTGQVVNVAGIPTVWDWDHDLDFDFFATEGVADTDDEDTDDEDTDDEDTDDEDMDYRYRYEDIDYEQILESMSMDVDGRGFRDGEGDQAQFFDPNGIVAVAGKLYVADMSNRRIRKIVPTSYAIGEKAKVQAVKNVLETRMGLNSSMGATGIPKRIYEFAGIAAPPKGTYVGGKRTAKKRRGTRTAKKRRGTRTAKKRRGTRTTRKRRAL